MFWLQRSFWVLPAIVAAILGIVSAVVVHNHRLRSVYKQHFVESRHERLFLAFLGFFIAAAVLAASRSPFTTTSALSTT